MDDSAAVRGAIRQVLQAKTRFKVCEAGDGNTAVQIAKDNRCDLVLLDILMPFPDGVATAAALRVGFPNIKIIGFSTVSKEVGEELVAQGTFDAFLSKLDGVTKLVGMLNSLLTDPPISD